MATLAHGVQQPPRPSTWLWEFLKEELAPYPGRAATVVRMVLAATVVMIVCVTFRIPYGFQGAVYALFITRESPRATLQSARTILLVTALSVAYILISAYFVISFPVLHFLWNVGSFFLAFYALSAMNNYGASVIFAIMIAVAVPLWDQQVSAETNVENTLRLALAAFIGVAVTAVIELAFRRMRPGDEIVLPLGEQLSAVEDLLRCFAEGRTVDPPVEKKVVRLGLLGTSMLRRLLRRSDYSLHYSAHMSGVVALVGRLVDIAASLTQLRFEPSVADRARLRNLADAVAGIHTALRNGQMPSLVQLNVNQESSQSVPLLREMATTITLIPQAYAGSQAIPEDLQTSDQTPMFRLLAADALVNPEHFKFALKGGLAASACYIIYNSVAWPGISTAVTTCLLTALSTIGASRQKQILRLVGALVGGVLIGMGSQIFILPYLDSVTGFTLLFVLVTTLSAWFMTSSPRLSYFGLQVAFSFYLINLQGFAAQTSLSVARDRVAGVLLGLFVMWLVFDQLWGSPAGVDMRRAFSSNLRLLGQLVREPVSGDIPAAVRRGYALRETINENFDKVRSLADGVLFEFGSSRQRDLALRDDIRRWQPQLRALFLMRIAALKYRLRLPGFELPEAVCVAQQKYDDTVAHMLDDMAERVEGSAPLVTSTLTDSSALLYQLATEAQQSPDGRIQSFVALVREIDRLMTSLAEEIRQAL